MTENNKDLKKNNNRNIQKLQNSGYFYYNFSFKKIQERHHYCLLCIDEGATY